MRQSLGLVLKNGLKYFKTPLVEGQYAVIPPKKVPEHIIKPNYVDNPNPIFGIYEGKIFTHNNTSISKMRKAAKIASNTLHATKQFIQQCHAKKTVLLAEDIDSFVFEHIIHQGAYPTPIGFMHFPKAVCISINECIVHGIPSLRPIEEGDKINIDVTVFYDGVHGDTNLTVIYGQALHEDVSKMVHYTQQALYKAIGVCKPGATFKDIGQAIEKYCSQHKIHSCPYFTGHGVGQLLHMPPLVAHNSVDGLNIPLKVGNIFTIQPIISLFPTLNNIKVWSDDFTCVSPNNPNAQFEHTLLIIEGGCEILTIRPDEVVPNPHNSIKNLI